MSYPRFRLFAGPNGSGKTHLFNHLKSKGVIHTEIYVNADKIEKELKQNKSFSFNAYRVKVSDAEFKKYILSSGVFKSKVKDKKFLLKFFIAGGKLKVKIPSIQINSYHASFVASYLAEKLIESKQSFCFETVMSHESKIEILQLAKKSGYKTYLYFVFTDNIELNVARVKLRHLQGFHDVDSNVIRSRAPRTFELMPVAFNIADEAYLIDNSGTMSVVVEKKKNKVIKCGNIPAVINPYIKNIL